MSAAPFLPIRVERDHPVPDRLMIVTFEIGMQMYALPVENVLEVVRLPALTPLAGAASEVCGLLNRYGRYVPVLDGHALLGEKALYGLNSQIIIAGLSSLHMDDAISVGLLVDQVRDVQTIQRPHITALTPGTAASFLRGLVRRDEYSILLFDISVLLSMAPKLTEEQA